MPNTLKKPMPKIPDQFGINAASKFAKDAKFKQRLANYLMLNPWLSRSEAVVILAARALENTEGFLPGRN